MSLQTGTNPTSRPYSALLEVYLAAGSSDYARTYEKFSRLPQQMQNRIFRYSCELQGDALKTSNIHGRQSMYSMTCVIFRASFNVSHLKPLTVWTRV